MRPFSILQRGHRPGRIALSAPLFAFSLAACGGGGGGGGGGPGPGPPLPPPWTSPTCETVTGEPIASYSPDAGVTIVPNAEPIEVDPAAVTTGIALTSGHGGLLFATHAATRSVYISTDAGCHWSLLAQRADGSFFNLSANDTHGFVTGGGLHRLGPDGSVDFVELPFDANYLATTRADPAAVYALSSDDEIWRGAGQGASWVRQGTRSPTPNLVQQLFINPNDSLHFVATGSGGELAVSFDGGNTWTASMGIVQDADSGTTRGVVFSSDSPVTDMYVNGSRAYRDDDGIIIRVDNFIARSLDGGLTWEDVVADGGDIRFGNAASLATRPGSTGEVIFTGIDCPFEPARLYHYRASDDSVTILTYGDQSEVRGFGSIVFHPTDPDVLYVGHKAEGECPM